MTVLVTGAAGFIGSNLCDALLARGDSVVGLDNFDDFYDPGRKQANVAAASQHRGFELVKGDIRDSDALARLPEGIDVVVHLAARAGVRPSIADPELYADVNVMGTARLLRWMASRSIRRLVFASSSSVYGNNRKVPFSEADPVDRPISPYAATKRAGELICSVASHLDGVQAACVRLFTVYGPRQRPDLAIHKFARILSEGGRIPMFGDGTTSRDYTYVDDTVAGLLGAMAWTGVEGHAFDIFNLGNHRTVSLSNMISTIADEMGVTPDIERLPAQPGDVERTWADIEHARETLGYDPEWSFRDGVREFLAWFTTTA